MDNIKEKLVELQDRWFSYDNREELEDFADYLIAHGVTIQKWISVEERLPKEEDADENASVLAIHKVYGGARCWLWDGVASHPEQFRCWMPLPEPPKGE